MERIRTYQIRRTSRLKSTCSKQYPRYLKFFKSSLNCPREIFSTISVTDKTKHSYLFWNRKNCLLNHSGKRLTDYFKITEGFIRTKRDGNLMKRGFTYL